MGADCSNDAALTTSPPTADKVVLAGPAVIQMQGLPGDRTRGNIESRLLTINENDLLDGFRHRPGKHPWIGEHVGKWLHAASLAWTNSKDSRLRQRMNPGTETSAPTDWRFFAVSGATGEIRRLSAITAADPVWMSAR
ncbi:MAG: hypothetical protein ACR2IE_15255 [Candidatus Sumerlaeaceae bacterium]